MWAFGSHSQNFRQVEESVLVVQLRTERPGIVPEARVLDADFALAPPKLPPRNFDTPGSLVEAAHREHVAGCVRGAEVAGAISEIANLVQRIPCRHLHHEAALHAGDDHGHVELVLRGMRQRDFVANCGVPWCRQR